MNTEPNESADKDADRSRDRRFEVMNRIGEHEWEEVCGPYKTYEEAEKARLKWFRNDEIPSMRVVGFYLPNSQDQEP